MLALKLALNKGMRASDDEQGINKLWPYDQTKRLLHVDVFVYVYLSHSHPVTEKSSHRRWSVKTNVFTNLAKSSRKTPVPEFLF